MTRDQFAAILDRLGYAPSQAAEAVGCDRSTVTRILAGAMQPSGPVWHSLRRHEILVRAKLEAPIPARRTGRPPKVA